MGRARARADLAKHELDSAQVVRLTIDWGTTFVLTGNPDRLLQDPDWPTTEATRVAAGGDGYAYVAQALQEDEEDGEPTLVAAVDLPGRA
eukprot:10432860-Lingulodinium_polyedra.AAC.1